MVNMPWKPTWWIHVLYLAGVLPHCCSGVQVYVRDEKRTTVLFQAVVLPCHYTSVSTQTPVVQWVYKSYCRDRTRDTFGLSDSLGGGGMGGTFGGGGGAAGRGGYETGTATADYLDCSDNSRTVRTVASISGSSVTLSEYYKNRDISIINKADLRIGEVQWGDSGVYICKVVISDDLEGPNEAKVELLVLGFSSDPEDLLPDFDLKIMPEWVFVAAVALGSVLFLLLVGVCWCQCCPHSCCCYVRCWCCPDTCCCPRHLYEAGKGIKTGSPTPQIAAFPPYFVSGVPTMLPIAPPSLVDKISSVPPSDSSLLGTVPFHGLVPFHPPSSQDQNSLRVLQYVEKQLAQFNPARSTSHQSCNLSELSSLHEVDTGFRQTYRNIQKKALPAIPDQERDPEPEPQHYRGNRSPELRHYRSDGPSSPQRRRDDPDVAGLQRHGDDAPPRRYSDNPPSSSSRTHRSNRSQHQRNHGQEERHERWNPRSEHLQRKTYRAAGRTGSLDELEESADSYRQRGAREEEEEEEMGEYDVQLREFNRYPSHWDGLPQRYHNDENGHRDDGDHPRREKKKNGRYISPLPSPTKRRGTWDGERPAPPPPRGSPPSSSSREKEYDGTFLDSLLERKARLRGVGPGKAEGDSDTPSRGSSRKSSGESSRHQSRSPSTRPEGEADSLPPYSEMERSRTDRPSPRPLPASARPPHAQAGRREEPRDKSRKTNTLLSRDSLIV